MGLETTTTRRAKTTPLAGGGLESLCFGNGEGIARYPQDHTKIEKNQQSDTYATHTTYIPTAQITLKKKKRSQIPHKTEPSAEIKRPRATARPPPTIQPLTNNAKSTQIINDENPKEAQRGASIPTKTKTKPKNIMENAQLSPSEIQKTKEKRRLFLKKTDAVRANNSPKRNEIIREQQTSSYLVGKAD